MPPKKTFEQDTRSPKQPLPLPPSDVDSENEDDYVIPDLHSTNNDDIYEEICCTLPVQVGTVSSKKKKPPLVARKPNKPTDPPKLSSNAEYVEMIPASSEGNNSKLHALPPPLPEPNVSISGNSKNLGHLPPEETYEEMNTSQQSPPPPQEVYEEMSPTIQTASVASERSASSLHPFHANSLTDYEAVVPCDELYEDMVPVTTKQPLSGTTVRHSQPPAPPLPPKGQEFTQNYSDSEQECIYATIPDVLH